MALRVYKKDGAPAVKCPRCDELVAPQKDNIFDGCDCPECGQPIDEDELSKYFEAVSEYVPEDEDFV